MEDLCTILTLAGKFKSISELQEYSNKQYTALQKAADKIKQQEDEIQHLRELLTNATPLMGQGPVEKRIITPEEAICEKQISLLQERGMTKELTLEEVKRLDLLIKNLRLVQGKGPKTLEAISIPKNFNHIDLLKLASVGATVVDKLDD